MSERQETLKVLVIEALKNAEANGETFDGWTLRDIAGDMIAYDDDISGMVEHEDEIGDYAYSNLESEIISVLYDMECEKEWNMKNIGSS